MHNDSLTFRGDAPLPQIHLHDAMGAEAPSGYYEFADDVLLRADVRGNLGQATATFAVSLDELAQLETDLSELTSLRRSDLRWEPWSGGFVLLLRVDAAAVGPPVECCAAVIHAEVGAGSSASSERYECVFRTNLPWLDGMLSSLRILASRFARFRG